MSNNALTAKYFLEILGHAAAGGVTEVCIAPESYQSRVGYFDDVELAENAIAKHDGKNLIYVSLNPVNRACIARANNRLIQARNRTTDNDTWRDSWFFLDIDPRRPKGVSSTQDELNEALKTGKAAYTFLVSAGAPRESTLTGMSGNGAYILVRLPDYEITPEHTDIKKRLLHFLSELFSNDKVEIDCKVYNPSRLICALGTMKVKGESIPERPHRRSEIRTVAGAKFDPALNQQVQPFDLYALAETFLPKPKGKTPKKPVTVAYSGGNFDMRDHLSKLEDYKETARGWGYARCPSHQGHSDTSFFINLDSGAYGCFSACTTEQIREAIGAPKNTPHNGNGDQPHGHTQQASGQTDEPSVKVVCLADVQAEQVKWLWHPRIPLGKLTLIEGDPGLGKSWLTCAMATAIAEGKGLPGMEQTEPQNVLMLSAEDGLADTIRPRLDSMNADVSRIFALDDAIVFDDTGLLLLEAAIIEHKPAAVFVDPMVAYLGAGVDLHRANETRAVMKQLARLAETHGCAIIAIRHLSKGGASRAIYRGLGSIDITAACRSVLLVGSDPDNTDERAIVHIKSNLAPLGEAIGYELKEGQFYWIGKSNLTAERILAASSGSQEANALSEAENFLKEILAEGPIYSNEVKKQAKEAGISERTLWRAKDSLKVKASNQGNSWYWHMPDKDVCQSSARSAKEEDIWQTSQVDTDKGVNTQQDGKAANSANPSETWQTSDDWGEL